jgi:hypothetical protein
MGCPPLWAEHGNAKLPGVKLGYVSHNILKKERVSLPLQLLKKRLRSSFRGELWRIRVEGGEFGCPDFVSGKGRPMA